MSLTDVLERVALHYEENSEYQLTRLEQDSPIEYAMTLRKLNEWIKEASIVADVGCGAGHYALHLARRRCQIHLIDLAKSLLLVAQHKLIEENLAQNMLNAKIASALNLDFLSDHSVDAVILLGPLYHLTQKEERQKALKEAWRVLKPNGILFAGGINRLTVLRELWGASRYPGTNELSLAIKEIKYDLSHFMATGISQEKVCPQLSSAYFTTGAEFSQECLSYFHQLEFIGLESFTAHTQLEFFNKDDQLKSDWLDLIELSGRTKEGVAASEHYLFIGRKRQEALY